MGIVNFDPNDSILLVDAEVEGLMGGEVRNLRMVLDTGSSSTIIPWDVAMTLGYDPARSASRKRLITGSGIEFAPEIKVKAFSSLGERIENFDVLCHDLPEESRVDGLLGLSFLRYFDPSIRFSRGEIELRLKERGNG